MEPTGPVPAAHSGDLNAGMNAGINADVIVVGAGIAGLVAARELNAQGLSTLVIESSDHVGGRIHTERKPGVYLEHGGIFHTHGYRALRKLFDEFGLADDAVDTPGGFYAAVRHRGSWKHLDYGSLTGPLRFGALSWSDRWSVLRAAIPALLARPADLGDLTTLARLDTKSAADGLTTRAATYFTAGPHEFLWGTASRQLSFAMLALQMHVFTGQLRELRGGIGRLTDAIANSLRVRTCTKVRRIEPGQDGVLVHLDGEQQPLRARGVVLACPADVAATVWADAPSEVRDHLTSIEYSRIDYVYLRTREPLRPRDGNRQIGMEVITEPEVGNSIIGGIYYANDWAEDGGLLLVTASPSVGAEHLNDSDLADRLQRDAEHLHPELVGQIIERTVMRDYPYTPTFSPGSIRRLTTARQHLPHQRVDLAGDHMTAPWVDGAIRSGQLAAQRLGQYLAAR
ncbi:MAG TPA: NAD(P)/FAD-dependent oxidoreductase [Pseudonocardia sp.]